MNSRQRGVSIAAVAVALAAVAVLYVLRDTRSASEPKAPPSGAMSPPVSTAAQPPTPPIAPSSVPAVVPRPRRAVSAAARKTLDEAALLAKIDDLGPSNLALTVELAREGLRRFPDSPRAPEFAMNLAKALLHMGRVDEAREEARTMLKKYPDSPFTREVEHHLLTNPPNPAH
jgi:hypothetical protein